MLHIHETANVIDFTRWNYDMPAKMCICNTLVIHVNIFYYETAVNTNLKRCNLHYLIYNICSYLFLYHFFLNWRDRNKSRVFYRLCIVEV